MLEKEEFELTDEGVTEEDLFYLDESQEANKINSDIDLFVQDGDKKGALPSTLVSIENGTIKVLRQGSVEV